MGELVERLEELHGRRHVEPVAAVAALGEPVQVPRQLDALLHQQDEIAPVERNFILLVKGIELQEPARARRVLQRRRARHGGDHEAPQGVRRPQRAHPGRAPSASASRSPSRHHVVPHLLHYERVGSPRRGMRAAAARRHAGQNGTCATKRGRDVAVQWWRCLFERLVDLGARHLLVGDEREDVGDAVEPRPPLVVRTHDVPGASAVSVISNVRARARE